MHFQKRTVNVIAKNFKLDADVLLITLWEISKEKFDYLKNEKSVIKNKEVKFVKEIINSKIKGNETVENKEKIKAPKRVHKTFDFSLIGKVVEPIFFLKKEEVLKIYEELVADFQGMDDPISPSGVKNNELLESALYHQETSFGDKRKYTTVESTAAAVMFSITHNHPFHNGNKRTAMVSMLVFLDRHNLCLTCDEDDLFKLSLKLADHKLVSEENFSNDAEIYALASWIHDNSKVMKKGERPVTLKKLKQILGHFNCIILSNGKVQRIVDSSFLGIPRKKVLVSANSIGDSISEGREVNKSLIKSIRDDLRLTPEHGIDSETFYSKTEFSSSEFIIKYKNLLKRLSKV